MTKVMARSILYLNGRITGWSVDRLVKNKIVCALTVSCQENNDNNAYNVNSGGTNNNNKNNSYIVRAVAALGEEVKTEWVDALIDCIRKKRGSHDCETYLMGNFELDLWMLIYEVETKSYTPGKSKCFVVTRPRPREIFAAFFRDRIVQHWAANKLEPMFEERFMRLGDVSFNCRKGHGTWDAIERLQYTPCSGDWIGKYDLQNFFMSIDKRLLLRKVSTFVFLHYVGSDKEVLMWLLEVIVMNCPQENCEIRGDVRNYKLLPKEKSLFNCDRWHGMPIGNITSQMLANFLMSLFDEWVIGWLSALKGTAQNGSTMDTMDTKGSALSHEEGDDKENFVYVRYADDFVIKARKEVLVAFRAEAARWLKENLGLTLHPKKLYLQKAERSVKFLGVVMCHGRLYTNNRAVNDFLKAMDRLEDAAMRCWHAVNIENAMMLRKAVSTVNCYLGLMSHTKSYAIRRKALSNVQWMWKCCWIDGHFEVVKIKDAYSVERLLIIKDSKEYGVQERKGKAGGNVHRKGVRSGTTSCYR
jgi:retron-type reverse transcriptase